MSLLSKRSLTELYNTDSTSNTHRESPVKLKKAKLDQSLTQPNHKPNTISRKNSSKVSLELETKTIKTKIFTLPVPAPVESASLSQSKGQPDYNNLKCIQECGKLVANNKLVAFPTETVYGLGANAFNDQATKQIFVAKGRPSDNPLIVHISTMQHLTEWILGSTPLNTWLQTLIDKFWPGPLSIVIPYPHQTKAKDIALKHMICDTVRAGLDSVAVRMPSSSIARALISTADCPIAAPSANLSGKPSPTLAKHVIHDMSGRIDAILAESGDNDAGTENKDNGRIGLESTVIKAENKAIVILRPGAITAQMMDEVLNGVAEENESSNEADVGDRIIIRYARSHGQTQSESERVESPGMKYKHYAPRKPLFMVSGHQLMHTLYYELINKHRLDQSRIGLMVCEENPLNKLGLLVQCVGSCSNLEQIAHNLFSCLREFDHNPRYNTIEFILCEVYPKQGIGTGLMDRLTRAANNLLVTDLNQVKDILTMTTTHTRTQKGGK